MLCFWCDDFKITVHICGIIDIRACASICHSFTSWKHLRTKVTPVIKENNIREIKRRNEFDVSQNCFTFDDNISV